MSQRLAASSDVKFDEIFPVRGALEDYNDALRDVARRWPMGSVTIVAE
jgi:hypothetical protein